MKTLRDIVLEKFMITKDTQVKTKNAEDLLKIDLPWKVQAIWKAYNGTECRGCMRKMESYFKKNSKPLTLVHSIKDKIKLSHRFLCAIILHWEEAIRVFKDEIIKREIMTEDEIDAHLCQIYSDNYKLNDVGRSYNINTQKISDALENYFKMYHIQYTKK